MNKDAGFLDKLRSDSVWEMRRAPMSSPTTAVRLGAMANIRFFKFSYKRNGGSRVFSKWRETDRILSQAQLLKLKQKINI